MQMSVGDGVRQELALLEQEFSAMEEFRNMAKTQGGRMTELGRAFLDFARENDIRQALVAKLLGISPGAVSQHYRR